MIVFQQLCMEKRAYDIYERDVFGAGSLHGPKPAGPAHMGASSAAAGAAYLATRKMMRGMGANRQGVSIGTVLPYAAAAAAGIKTKRALDARAAARKNANGRAQ